MKLLITFALLTVGAAQAKSIPSIADCKVTDRATLMTGTMKVENTRLTGKAATEKAAALTAKGATVESTVDVLGVVRFKTVEKRTTLETNGTEVDSCEGMYFADKSETCTVDATAAVCETFCKVEWQGQDCR